jgi:hypothetical protein
MFFILNNIIRFVWAKDEFTNDKQMSSYTYDPNNFNLVDELRTAHRKTAETEDNETLQKSLSVLDPSLDLGKLTHFKTLRNATRYYRHVDSGRVYAYNFAYCRWYAATDETEWQS